VEADSGSLDFGGRTIELDIGHLAPMDKVEGIQARLQNLGYKIDAIDGDDSTDGYKDAVKAFQAAQKIGVDAVVGPRTRRRLKKAYGC
jgi:peptidoglycan hydrolase-like protein with peptidoglycan-binding domain